ncbi:asparagine synthase (glutamine-hydrolyzing) [Candidatus Wolfebacteria bacterium]|nr:asparagine synthase (glutamine-hydrolyzing) [Candidatus Wolfebacteria bacterium]
MCGIVGTVGTIPTRDRFEKSRDVLEHRGQDDFGLFYEPVQGIALGHRRLSIIDISSAGHQPFFSNDKRFILIFNGEIYNYLEIKKELEDFYNFKTKTDTEVALASYLKWGEKCLEKFNGMYAFAIWDVKEKKLFCARDRLGVKPFFYYFNGKQFAFASEIKALLKLEIKTSPNEPIIFDFLYHGMYDHTDETFFKGIKTLSPGHFIIYKEGKMQIYKYWDLADLRDREIRDPGEEIVKENFKTLLTDSIKLRFRSDVPVGVNLSSGLDSNSLYHFALQVTKNDLHTFSMCLESNEYNECGLVEEMLDAKYRKFWHSCYLNPQEVLGAAEKMNEIQDQPYGGIPTIAYDFLIKLSEDFKTVVLLEGQGVDEILAGYPYYQIEHEKDISSNLSNISTVHYGQDMSKLIPKQVLDGDFVNLYKERELNFFQPFKSHLLNAQYRDIRYAKLPRVLRFNDHVTMHHGRELRVPFLDYRIVEFCFFLPAKYKIRGQSQKYILRKLMAGIIPPETKDRRKKVFGAIQTEWFRRYFKKQITDLLNDSSFKNLGYWNYKNLDMEVKKFYNGQVTNSFFIWQCLNLKMWFKNFFDK